MQLRQTLGRLPIRLTKPDDTVLISTVRPWSAAAWFFVPALFLAALVWTPPHAVDVALSRPFFNGFAWPLHGDFLFAQIFHKALKGIPILIALAAFVVLGFGALEHHRTRRANAFLELGLKRLGYLVLSMAACVLTVWWLKGSTGVACPWTVVPFGGKDPVVDPTFSWSFRAGSCWPGGHAGTGFCLFGLYFMLRDAHPKAARIGFVLALALGLLCGTTRLMQGAHFASHNVATMLIDWLVSAALYVLCFDRRHVIRRLAAGIAGRYSLSGVILTTALWWTLVLNAPLFKAAAPVSSIDALALISLMLALFLGSALVLTAASILPRGIFAACVILLSAAGAASAACMASGEPAGLCCSRDLAQAARSLTPGSAAVFLAIIAPPLWGALRVRPAAKDGSGAARGLAKLAVAGVMAGSVFLLVESNASDLKGILDEEHRLLNHMAPISILGCAFDSLSSNSWGTEHLMGSVLGSTGAP